MTNEEPIKRSEFEYGTFRKWSTHLHFGSSRYAQVDEGIYMKQPEGYRMVQIVCAS